ncbi:SPOR domain-containing protein [Nafulsella turpanensis]|uniref:SPOR domain-containing protein n=1 Tax=Nafulsella turpanensis TaxID=1265690 RepID=UPI00034D898D|nr:SPOR domain-containing protein [Nafulsella turpanensis]
MIEKDDQNRKNDEEAGKPPYNDADNEYGLPEAEYTPIQQEWAVYEEETTHNQYVADEDIQPQQKASSWPMWTALGVILVLAGIFVYFFLIDAGTEPELIAETPKKAVEATVIAEETAPEEVPAEEEWVAAEEEPEMGTISSVSSRTGRYYVVAGSFIDADLARDYAEELASKGTDAKIIEPSGTRKFYRLSVKDAESLVDLQAELDSLRAKFGENVWIVKY